MAIGARNTQRCGGRRRDFVLLSQSRDRVKWTISLYKGNRGGSKTDYIRAEKQAKLEEKDRLNLRGSYLKLLYKKNKLWKERRPEGSAVISPCQCTVKWDKAVTDQVGHGKKAMSSQKNVSITTRRRA
jgi:hypothetical protein